MSIKMKKVATFIYHMARYRKITRGNFGCFNST